MNLASIQKVISVEPIEGADKIEKIGVLGWQIVAKKGEFKVGDACCYIQIDTICPEIPYFEFLRERKFRVRTIKLRQQISQGLILSIKDCCKITDQPFLIKEGVDISDLLGIQKYSKTVELPDNMPKMPKKWYKKWLWLFKQKVLVKVFPSLTQVNRRPFPNELVSRTDEERIQNMPWIFEKFQGKIFCASEKLDGSSITIIYDEVNRLVFGKKKIYRICSRNFELFNKQNEWYKVFEETDFKQYIDLLVLHFQTKKIIVQGEYIGKPQGNPYKVENQIRLFNIFVEGKRLNPDAFRTVCNEYHIPTCPMLPAVMITTLAELLKLAEGKSLLNKDTEREGIVLRSLDGDVSFKVVSNNFLLKNQE